MADATEILRRAEFADKIAKSPYWAVLLTETQGQIMHQWLNTKPEDVTQREAAYAQCRALVSLNAELLRWRNAGVFAADDADTPAPSA